MKKQMNALVVIVVVCTLIIAGCGSNAPATPTQRKDPESVFKGITEALNKKDVEAATALLADDVMQTLIPAPSGTGVYKGKEAMRARFQEVVAANPTHKIISCQTSGDKVTCHATYTDDSIRPLGFDLEFNVEAVAQDGLLKTVTWTMTDQSLAKLQAAMPAPTPVPTQSTALPAPTPAPTKSAAPLGPEVLASKAEDVIGVWLIGRLLVSGTARFEFKPDGTYSIVGASGEPAGVPIDSGKYKVEGNQLKLDTDCLTVKGDVIQCVAIYEAYVIRQGGKPVMLRLIAIDDQGFERRQTLNKQRLPLVEP